MQFFKNGKKGKFSIHRPAKLVPILPETIH